jgi:hypothetical protein
MSFKQTTQHARTFAVALSSALSATLAATLATTIATTAAAAEQTNHPVSFTGGKLLATGGVSPIEGAAGGGLTPWALIGGYGTSEQIGANAFATRAKSKDYLLDVTGALVGLYDRVELSVAEQKFDTRDVGAALGLGRGFTFKQRIIGAKWRIAGDAVLDQDRWLPQIAVGVQHKKNNQPAIVRAVGAKDDKGTDFYISATKLYLEPAVLVNATVRATKANQTGLLGFGGDRGDKHEFMLEASIAKLLSKNWIVGVEYRKKPSNLGFAREQDWSDIFVAWVPNKHVSVTAAYVMLGDIATIKKQKATYLSLQVGL